MDSTTAPQLSASFPAKNQGEQAQTLALLAALAHPVQRKEAAGALARHLGAEDLIVFVRDPEIDLLLPAAGFAQTLPQGQAWHAFLAACIKQGMHTAELPFPDEHTIRHATGFASDETALVLLGSGPLSAEVTSVCLLLPLLQAAFTGEQATQTARATAAIAQKAAQESQALALSLDGTREALQRVLSETNALIEAIPDAVYVCDTSGELVRVNAQGVSLLGLRTGQALNASPIYTLYYPDGTPIPPEEHALSHALRGVTRMDYHFLLRRHDSDQEVHLLISSAPIRNTIGQITGAVAVATDITEMYRLERQKDEFLSIASHELKTPLTSLKGLTQLTRRRLERTGADEVRFLELMERSITRMERLIKDLLDVTRIDAGRLALRLQLCDLTTLCQQAVEEQCLMSNRAIELLLPDIPIMIEIDPERINQVISNLLSNAHKYTGAECPVTLRLWQEENQACVAVQDEGEGIPAEALSHLFERFYRVAGTEVRSGSGVGLGLGLYICHSIIEQHHGHIGVRSQPGQGTTFWFKLPLAAQF